MPENYPALSPLLGSQQPGDEGAWAGRYVDRQAGYLFRGFNHFLQSQMHLVIFVLSFSLAALNRTLVVSSPHKRRRKKTKKKKQRRSRPGRRGNANGRVVGGVGACELCDIRRCLHTLTVSLSGPGRPNSFAFLHSGKHKDRICCWLESTPTFQGWDAPKRPPSVRLPSPQFALTPKPWPTFL